MSSDHLHRGGTEFNSLGHPHQQQSAPQQQQQQISAQAASDNNNAAGTNGNSSTTTTAAAAQTQVQAEQPKKAKRKRITPEQLEDLVGLFEKTDTPSFEIRESLAKKLGMTNREIQVWFQNRRAKANRIKINEQAALHHQQHLQHQQMQQQQQQQQQHMQGHHHLAHHHRSNSSNGFGGPHSGLVHSAPATPLQTLPGHHLHHHQNSNSSSGGGGDPSAYGYFSANGSSSPPMTMPTPTPRVHSSHSQHGQANRRPVSLYDMGSYGHSLRTQQFQPQKPGQFQPQHNPSSPSGHYGQNAHAHAGGNGHSAGPYGMDIILPANSSSSSSQRSILLPPPISTMQPRRPGQPLDEYNEDSRRLNRHERTMSEGHPAGYISPTSMSPISPPPDRHMDTQYRDEHDEDSPTSVTHSSPFPNGGNHTSNSSQSNSNRHSASLASFGLKPMGKDRPEEVEANVIPRERLSASAYYDNPAQAAKNRRSYDDALYDEHQQLMRDNFNMDKRLVITEDEPRPESAIDLLAYAAAFVQESEVHKKDIGKDMGQQETRNELRQLGQLNSNNKRQSFHGPSGYPSKEPFQEESTSSSRYSSNNSMAWEASSSVIGNSNGNDVMPVPRRRGGDDGPYAPRRPRPVTYGGSGFLYDHHENQFLPNSPPSSLGGTYGRTPSARDHSRRLNRNSTEVGSSGLLLQRGLTRPRRSSSTATAGLMNSHPPSSSMPVLPPIINESRLLSPAMVPSPQFGASRLTRQDSQGNTINLSNGTRDSPGSDSYSRDSYNDDMEDIEDEETEYQRQRAAKRRSGNINSFFGMGVK
ncbi:hypothetical protein EDD11_007110 [Mortierella claussenii]|nr:hypothetical protein EDD11_007110 [Mortierella claussenii]